MSAQVSFKRSEQLFEEAKKVIPGGVNSEIRGPAWGVNPGEFPLFITKGKGSKIYDVDGNEFIDYVCAYGPIILGHAHPAVDNAVKEQMDKGFLFGLSIELEIELAKLIIKHVPCAEMVRIATTGSDVTTAAVRVARLYTGKEKIAVMDEMYHGTHDWCQVGVAGGTEINYYKTLITWGVPANVLDNIIILPWNKIEVIEKIIKRYHNELAAIIAEPIVPFVPPVDDFWKAVKELTERYDILLIFDEVKTGFRLGLGGAQEKFGVFPDLATFAKAMANGYPVSAIAGRKDIMELIGKYETRLAGTYNANGIGCAAGVATIKELEKPGTFENLYKIGEKLQKGIKDAIADTGVKAVVQGPEPGPFVVLFTELEEVRYFADLKKVDRVKGQVFARELAKRGIWHHPNYIWYLTTSHTEEDVEKTIQAVYEALKVVKKAEGAAVTEIVTGL